MSTQAALEATRSGTSDPSLPSAVTSRDETIENWIGAGKEAGSIVVR
jgi:hypothetical protein